MPDVEILDVQQVNPETLLCHGGVAGRNYRVAVPKADVDRAATKAAKQRVVALALKAEWDRHQTTPVDLVGRVSLP